MSIASSSPAAPSSVKKLITLKSSDGDTFKVEESVALLSETIKLASAENSDSAIELQDITGPVLAVIIWYLNEVSAGNESVDDFAEELIDDQEMLFGVLRAANSLKIESLLDLMCKTVAGMMAGKSTEEIGRIFHIRCDYTVAELKEFQEETAIFKYLGEKDITWVDIYLVDKSEDFEHE